MDTSAFDHVLSSMEAMNGNSFAVFDSQDNNQGTAAIQSSIAGIPPVEGAVAGYGFDASPGKTGDEANEKECIWRVR